MTQEKIQEALIELNTTDLENVLTTLYSIFNDCNKYTFSEERKVRAKIQYEKLNKVYEEFFVENL